MQVRDDVVVAGDGCGVGWYALLDSLCVFGLECAAEPVGDFPLVGEWLGGDPCPVVGVVLLLQVFGDAALVDAVRVAAHWCRGSNRSGRGGARNIDSNEKRLLQLRRRPPHRNWAINDSAAREADSEYLSRSTRGQALGLTLDQFTAHRDLSPWSRTGDVPSVFVD